MKFEKKSEQKKGPVIDALPPSGRKADKQIFLTPRRGQKNLSRKKISF